MDSKEEKSRSQIVNERYKTVRIKVEDYKLLRKYAYRNEMPMVEAVSKVIELLIEKEGK